MFLLAVDKCMPEMHLGQPGLTYSARGMNLKKQEIHDIFIKAK